MATIKEGGRFAGEVTQAKKDGSRIPVDSRVISLEDDQAGITGWVAVNRDITRRKQTEESLRQSEAHYRSLLVSPSLREIMGVSNPYDLATWFDENIRPDDLARVLQSQKDCVERNIPFNQQMRIYHPIKHEWRWIQAIAHPLLDSGDGHVYFNGIIIDISGQKEAEAALRESEVRYRTLAIPHLWESRPEQARKSLADLHRLNRGALAEMRSLLLELRPDALAHMSLKELLQQLTNALMGRSRLVTSLQVEGDYDPAPEVRIAFYRVAQEAFMDKINQVVGAHIGPHSREY